jgi:hypothetical protein
MNNTGKRRRYWRRELDVDSSISALISDAVSRRRERTKEPPALAATRARAVLAGFVGLEMLTLCASFGELRICLILKPDEEVRPVVPYGVQVARDERPSRTDAPGA